MGVCIFCGVPGLPEAHVVPRSHGGLGIEQNIITACRPCHDRLDNSVHRQQMLQVAAAYLEQFYPGWNPQNLIYDKWLKDKANENQENAPFCQNADCSDYKTTKPQNDRVRQESDIVGNSKHGGLGGEHIEKWLKDKGEPPQGFYFL